MDAARDKVHRHEQGGEESEQPPDVRVKVWRVARGGEDSRQPGKAEQPQQARHVGEADEGLDVRGRGVEGRAESRREDEGEGQHAE